MGKQLTMPVWYILVSDTGGDIEHDDTALAVDVVAISQTTEFLLACGIPHIELDVSVILHTNKQRKQGRLFVQTHGSESERVNFDAQGCNVFLLEFSCQVALHKGSLCRCWSAMIPNGLKMLLLLLLLL